MNKSQIKESTSALSPDFSQHGTGELSVNKWEYKVTCVIIWKINSDISL